MSNADLVQYIVEQASQAGEVRARKMFGDYCLYCDGKPVGLICDNYLYLKPLKQLEPPLPDHFDMVHAKAAAKVLLFLYTQICVRFSYLFPTS